MHPCYIKQQISKADWTKKENPEKIDFSLDFVYLFTDKLKVVIRPLHIFGKDSFRPITLETPQIP